MNALRKKAIEGLEEGDTFEIRRTFSDAEIVQFEALSRDHNPVHSDTLYAEAKGFNSVIAHGLLTATLITEIGGQLGWLATTMSFSFKRPVYAGDELTCVWKIVAIDDRNRAQAEVIITNSSGQAVLLAETTGVIPNEIEKKLLGESRSSIKPLADK
ncbi:MaoC family dehydratase [Pseudomonas kribbensis]|uniref:MaoC family dehydratase n=1 Tax=Pseudomonas kribbensis TaxID=1628086 RepID=A0A4Y8VGR9_9PSED|nr:MaoC family dehydratase [Pseudomonas kribbensis]TFH79941.1 MaoC family dehydratase [Pseudomonas kribbensis]